MAGVAKKGLAWYTVIKRPLIAYANASCEGAAGVKSATVLKTTPNPPIRNRPRRKALCSGCRASHHRAKAYSANSSATAPKYPHIAIKDAEAEDAAAGRNDGR